MRTAAPGFTYGTGVGQRRWRERHLKEKDLRNTYRIEIERNLVLRALVNDGRLTEAETSDPALVERELCRIISGWVVAVNKGK